MIRYKIDHNIFAKYTNVMAHAAQTGSDTVITFDAGDIITLQHVTMTS